MIRGTTTATVSYSAEYNTADLFRRGDIGLEIIRKEEDLPEGSNLEIQQT